MKNARAKILFFTVKYANLWGSCCRCRRGCLSFLLSRYYGVRLSQLLSLLKICSQRYSEGTVIKKKKKYEVLFLHSVDRKNSFDLKRSLLYYMQESVFLGTKSLVDSIRHFIRDPSGVFSVCHVCECRIVQ